MKIKIIVFTVLWLGVILYPVILQARPNGFFYKSIDCSNSDAIYLYKIIQAPNYTWGYDILRDGKIFIHQPNKPGLPGMDGFTAKEDAVKVAQYVIAKIKKGEMPPTVSLEELRALKLAYYAN